MGAALLSRRLAPWEPQSWTSLWKYGPGETLRGACLSTAGSRTWRPATGGGPVLATSFLEPLTVGSFERGPVRPAADTSCIV